MQNMTPLQMTDLLPLCVYEPYGATIIALFPGAGLTRLRLDDEACFTKGGLPRTPNRRHTAIGSAEGEVEREY